MNNEMFGGFLRHSLTVLAGAILANSSDSLESLIPTLMNNLTKGDFNSVVGTAIVIFAILWSMWTKTSTETKDTIVKKLSLKK